MQNEAGRRLMAGNKRSSNKRPGGVGMGNPLLEKTFVCWTGLVTPATRPTVKSQPAPGSALHAPPFRSSSASTLQHNFRPIWIMPQRWQAPSKCRMQSVERRMTGAKPLKCRMQSAECQRPRSLRDVTVLFDESHQLVRPERGCTGSSTRTAGDKPLKVCRPLGTADTPLKDQAGLAEC